MGLKKGEKIKRLKKITITSTRKEQLWDICQDDVIKEGFPDMTPWQFTEFYDSQNNLGVAQEVNRIEFRYGWD